MQGMDRVWPLAGLYFVAVCWLLLSPNPRQFTFEASGPWVVVPAASSRVPEQAQLADIKLDINQASLAELIALPDVGERLATTVLVARPFGCDAALLQIVGPGRLLRLRPFLKPLPKNCRNPAEGVK